MTRNVRGGKKAKKASRFKTQQGNEKRSDIVWKEDLQEYGRVTRMLGDCRCEIMSLDNQSMWIGHIRGKMKKRCWIRVGDYVLFSYREFQTSKCDILHKYTTMEEIDSIHPPTSASSSSMIEEEEDIELSCL